MAARPSADDQWPNITRAAAPLLHLVIQLFNEILARCIFAADVYLYELTSVVGDYI